MSIMNLLDRLIKETNYTIAEQVSRSWRDREHVGYAVATRDVSTIHYCIWLTGMYDNCNITLWDLIDLSLTYIVEKIIIDTWNATLGRTVYKRC